jgi:hypothetical protein
MEERLVDVRQAGFSKHLIDAVLSDLANLPAQRLACAERVTRLKSQALVTLTALDCWLHLNLD